MTTAFAAGYFGTAGTADSMLDLTVDAADLHDLVARGAIVVDIRSRTQRERQGVLTGSAAVDARSASDLLDPMSAVRLSWVHQAQEVVLVSDDGLDAELFAWELRSRGANGVRAVDGGFEAIRAAGGLLLLAAAQHVQRDAATLASH